MSSILCIFIGIILGSILCYLLVSLELSDKDNLIEDYKKGIKIHNDRELKLIFINQSIKDYVKNQLNMLKSNEKDLKTNEDKILAAAMYKTLKDVEQEIKQLEKNSEKLPK